MSAISETYNRIWNLQILELVDILPNVFLTNKTELDYYW